MNKVIEIVLWMVLAVIGGLGGGYYAMTHFAPSEMDAPVVVLDVKEFINDAITGPKGELKADQVAVGIRQAMDVAHVYASKGYLVIDKQSVLAAPDQYYVKKPSPLPEKGLQ